MGDGGHEAAHEQGQPEKYPGGIFGDGGQGIARTGAKKRVGGRAAKRHARARLLLGQLQQDQENQDDTIQKQDDGKKTNNTFIIFFFNSGPTVSGWNS